MKKLLQLLGFVALSSSTFAQTQVPNSDFENWSLEKPAYDFYAPDNWSDGAGCASINDGTESCQFFIARTTDAQSGKYALKHFDQTPKFGTNTSYSTYSNAGAGFSTPAFTGRPTSVSFYYKYTSDDAQPMEIYFHLFSGDIFDPTTVAEGTYSFSANQTTYKKIDLPLIYSSNGDPTNIFISSDYTQKPTTALDTLTWDNIVFNYTTTDVTDKSSPDYFTVSTNNKVLSTSRDINTVTILDYTGKTVASFNTASSNFNVSQLKTGMYILTGMVNENPFSRKIIIE